MRARIFRLPVIEKIERGPVLEARRLIFASGEMAQVCNGEPIPYITYIEFPLGEHLLPRGNHYHTSKHEYIYIAFGKLRAIFYDFETSETREAIVERGDLIYHPSNCAHVYFPIEHTHAIEFASEIYNPDDTIPYRFDPSEMHASLAIEMNFPFAVELES